jgi:imidazolonepropionase-like amidohydrolase
MFRVQIAALMALLAASYLPNRAAAEPDPPPPQSTVLFQDVRIFDGKSGSLSAPSSVLVRGNKIDKISAGPVSIDNIANAITIDGGGRTLMPGLIDMHWHAILVRPNPVEALASDIGYLNLLAGAEATATLMRGFTTIRDMGGPMPSV